MSDPGQLGSFMIPLILEPGPHSLEDPAVGADDHHGELPDGKARNVIGEVALVVALVGVVLVWALQDSLYLIGFIICGIAFVAGAITVFFRGRRRSSAVAALVVGAVPFVFTVVRGIYGF